MEWFLCNFYASQLLLSLPSSSEPRFLWICQHDVHFSPIRKLDELASIEIVECEQNWHWMMLDLIRYSLASFNELLRCCDVGSSKESFLWRPIGFSVSPYRCALCPLSDATKAQFKSSHAMCRRRQYDGKHTHMRPLRPFRPFTIHNMMIASFSIVNVAHSSIFIIMDVSHSFNRSRTSHLNRSGISETWPLNSIDHFLRNLEQINSHSVYPL